MADDKKTDTSKNVKTPVFRVSFPEVFRARAMEEGKEPKYSITMLFPKGTDLSALQAACKAVIVERFGADQAKWPKGLRSPFRDQGEKEYEGYEAGAMFIRATSKQKPGLVDAQVKPIEDESAFYPGCFAMATIRPFYYDQKGNKGIAFGLGNIQKVRDGEPLGGRTRPENDFEPVAGGDDAGGNGSADELFQ